MKAYKGFDKDWKCRDFQFEVGKTYMHDGPVSLCNSGFHACESPLDIWNYYPPVDGNQAAEVELDATDEKENDSKRVGKSITIKAALTIAGLVSAQVEWCQKNADAKNIASGDYSKAASSGDYSTAASSGSYSTAASSGDSSKAACDTDGFACVAGVSGKVKGNAGSAMSCGYKDTNDKNRIAVAYVGEDGIEEDTWYSPDQNGKWIKQ
jgi:hypothetical protein